MPNSYTPCTSSDCKTAISEISDICKKPEVWFVGWLEISSAPKGIGASVVSSSVKQR